MDNILPSAVYLLCFVTSSTCAWLLMRSHRTTRTKLLFWSGLCFIFLALNNFLVIVDLLLLPQLDFRIARNALSLCAVTVLLFGFIWDQEE